MHAHSRGVLGAGVALLVGPTDQPGFCFLFIIALLRWGGFWYASGDGTSVGRQALGAVMEVNENTGSCID